MILYRPVGEAEFKLIEQSGFTKFPPHLPEQPIFYPVLNERYAVEIASKWNTKYNANKKGYVTKFIVSDDYIAKFDVQTVDASYHQEIWVPSEYSDIKQVDSAYVMPMSMKRYATYLSSK